MSIHRAYGSNWWHDGARGVPLGALRGLGDDITDQINADYAAILAAPSSGDYGSPDLSVSPISTPSAGPSWESAVQTGVQDAFNFTKLLNPIPQGCTQIIGPNGTSQTTCAPAGQYPAALPGLPSSLTSYLPLLLIVGVGLFAVSALGGRH